MKKIKRVLTMTPRQRMAFDHPVAAPNEAAKAVFCRVTLAAGFWCKSILAVCWDIEGPYPAPVWLACVGIYRADSKQPVALDEPGAMRAAQSVAAGLLRRVGKDGLDREVLDGALFCLKRPLSERELTAISPAWLASPPDLTQAESPA